MVNYQGKNIVIIGLGLTGLSCVNYFLKRGVRPYVMDTRFSPPGLDRLPKQIKFHFGSLNEDYLLTADVIVISPGITLMHPSLNIAANAGIEIISDIELFCREVRVPIIAITGSNGKSTVTTLVGEMAKASGINIGIGGNIGLPVLALLESTYDLYVLELSSFQLENTYSLQAVAATILNITEDHMDRYPFGLKQYRAAKLRIYENAKKCIVNIEDIMTIPEHDIKERCISFGISMGDYSLNCYNGETYLCVKGEKIMNVKKIKISGQHNYANALAALALADTIGLSRESSLKILTTFSGLEHRIQLVVENKGVRWINDSKATNVSSTKAALKSLQFDGTLYLLLGGNDRFSDFSPLKHYLINVNVRIYCFGSNRGRLMKFFPDIARQTETMEQAMRQISPQLKAGDTVLLSPACSSIDQFNNFEQRGEIFTLLAKELS